MPEETSPLRLNQAVAQTGFCSRRKADELITAGRIAINGQICTNFGQPVDPYRDNLAVDGKNLSFKKSAYIALNKPKGIVTTTADERLRRTVIDLLPQNLRHLKPIGRLDMNSEGLLLLTNDGDFAQRLAHPSQHLPKLYLVRIKGNITNQELDMLENGILLDDGLTLPASVQLVGCNKTYCEVEMTLIEGRNRQIRRMFAYLGYPVVRLVRLAIGGLQLGEIAPGTWRYLTSQEVSQLLNTTQNDDDA